MESVLKHTLNYSGTVQPVKQSVDASGNPIEDANGPVYEPDGRPPRQRE